MKMTNIVLTGILLLISINKLNAQEIQLIDSLFYRGVHAYRDGQFQEALQHLEFLDRVYPGHRRTTGSLLMQAKSLDRLGEYQRAVESYDELLKDYPSSNYADDARYGKAEALYQLNAFEDAVRTLFQLLDSGGDTRLLHKAANLSSDIMDFRLDIDALKRLHDTVPDERGQAAITLRLVQRLSRQGRHQQCKDLIQGFLDRFPRSVYLVEMQQRLRQIDQLARGSVKLGVILPITGDMAEQGKAVLSGIKYAVDKHNSAGNTKVELLVKDTHGEMIPAIQAVQELCDKGDLVAIIGELESDRTAAIAAVAQERQVPLLAPTASAQGIAEVGSFIYQLSPPLNARAKMLAEYAVSGLGLRTFAVLAESGPYGRIMYSAFKASLESLGGEILIDKWYYTGDEHLGVQFKAIREFGLMKMLSDSVLIRVPKEALENQPPIPGVQYVDRGIEALVDSTALSVTTFDGMFLPVLNEDLQYVIPQFAKFNFDAKVFGGVPWNDVDILEDHSRFIDRRYLDGLVFLSDFYVDPSNFQYNEFMNDYRLAMRRSPEKLDIFGYDGASIILSIIGQERPDRNKVLGQLARIQNFPAIQGMVTFGPDRVNRSIHLMQFRGGRVVPIR